MGERARRGVAIFDALMPGLVRLSGGDLQAIAPLVSWLLLLALALARRDRIAAIPSGGSADEWIALATLVGALWLVWRWGRSAPAGRAGAADAVPGIGSPGRETQWELTRRSFRRHRTATLGLLLVGALLLLSLLAPLVAPHDPAAQGADIVATRFQSPSLEHLMGTDRFGRDVFSRVVYGGRISLLIGLLAVTIAVTLGTAVGAIAGYLRGPVDALAMRFVDLLLSFPRLVLLVTVAALFQPSIALITLVLGFTGWMGTSRVVRGEVLSVREREYVQAARALGFGHRRILYRHILPNAVGPVIVAASLGIGNTILAEAALSFLGLGVQPPAPSWGNMVASGRDVMLDAPWITAFPGLAIVATVMAFNLVGDGLRDALDPRTVGEP